MEKLGLRRKKNQGNSFIMVIATLSFLAVLVAAILVAVALIYRLKAYNLNSRDNFYYLEQALDEIYAGVGKDAMVNLNKAYDETLEVMIYYDTLQKAYVTRTNEEANKMMKNTYMYLMKNDTVYGDDSKLEARLKSFLSNAYHPSTNKSGVQLDVDGMQIDKNDDDTYKIKNLVLRREAKYSTVNARSETDLASGEDPNEALAAADSFVQTITTDIVIGKPEFDVSFNVISADLNTLYGYSMVADMGIEITGPATTSSDQMQTALGKLVTINGNIYAASDFYNKSYNEAADGSAKTGVGYVNMKDGKALETGDAPTKANHQEVEPGEQAKQAATDNKVETAVQSCRTTSYTDDQLKMFDGKNLKSKYSGLYVDGATVALTSDQIIIPGSLAVMNCGDVTVTSLTKSSDTKSAASVWADSIILDGYSLKLDKDGNQLKGSKLNMVANCYISDDLELNSNSSEFLLNGQYYGYNYASLDNRVYSKDAIEGYRVGSSTVWGGLKHVFTKDTDAGIKDGQGIEGQAHYNSSAIIVNGENSKLDLSLADALYVAGQSYIEVSKNTTTDSKDVKKVAISVTAKDGASETVETEIAAETDEYLTRDDNKTPSDKSDDKNYTTVNENGKNTETPLQDYRTGEAISVKSNQLAYNLLTYIPRNYITDDGVNLYVDLYNSGIYQLDAFKKIWGKGVDEDDTSAMLAAFSKVPIIKSDVSGKTYYFFDFSKVQNVDKDVMNTFIAEYAALFKTPGQSELAEGKGLPDIADYDHFKVQMIAVSNSKNDPDYSNIYTNSAITTRQNGKYTIVANSSNLTPLQQAAKNINKAVDDARRSETKLSEDESDQSNASVYSQQISARLQDQYKEMKWLLTNTSPESHFVTNAHNIDEDYITPLNHYFDFSMISNERTGYVGTESGYGVWYAAGDVKVGAKEATFTENEELPGNLKGDHVSGHEKTSKYNFRDGKLRGIIIAKGEVSFDNDVKEFEGLIVTGSKVIINNFGNYKVVTVQVDEDGNEETKEDDVANNSMSFIANEEIVKTILKECDASRAYGSKFENPDDPNTIDYSYICDTFRMFVSQYNPDGTDTSSELQPMKSVSAVQFEDIVSFENWQKNVD